MPALSRKNEVLHEQRQFLFDKKWRMPYVISYVHLWQDDDDETLDIEAELMVSNGSTTLFFDPSFGETDQCVTHLIVAQGLVIHLDKLINALGEAKERVQQSTEKLHVTEVLFQERYFLYPPVSDHNYDAIISSSVSLTEASRANMEVQLTQTWTDGNHSIEEWENFYQFDNIDDSIVAYTRLRNQIQDYGDALALAIDRVKKDRKIGDELWEVT